MRLGDVAGKGYNNDIWKISANCNLKYIALFYSCLYYTHKKRNKNRAI